MLQTPLLRCDCCGLSVSPQSGEDCPRCNYPIDLAKEERFLESTVRDLQRVADYGGANLTIAGLIHRYRMRLSYLHQAKLGVVPAKPTPSPERARSADVKPSVSAPVERSEVVPARPAMT